MLVNCRIIDSSLQSFTPSNHAFTQTGVLWDGAVTTNFQNQKELKTNKINNPEPI